jgi:hypothetical protein
LRPAAIFFKTLFPYLGIRLGKVAATWG